MTRLVSQRIQERSIHATSKTQRPVRETPPIALRRRHVLLTWISSALWTVPVVIADAAETPDDASPLIQDLLKKTEENRERRKKERLADYNKRNFKDFFSVTLDSRELTEETKSQIEKWLQENQ